MENQSKGLAIASLVLGIIAVVFNFCFAYAGIVFAIIGLILGIIAVVKKQGGMAVAGVVLSVIALILTIYWTVVIIGAAVSY